MSPSSPSCCCPTNPFICFGTTALRDEYYRALSTDNRDLNSGPHDSTHTLPISPLLLYPAVAACSLPSPPHFLLPPTPPLLRSPPPPPSLLPHAPFPPFPPRRRPLLLLGVLRAQIRDTWSNSSRPAAWASLLPALIAACITLFHFKESAEKPVPGRQQKVKTQLTPIRALSQAPREVMKYGSGEICNALLSGLSYNGVHANYACRLPPAPGRGPPSARPARAPAGWGRGTRGRRGGRGEGRVGRGKKGGRTMGKGEGWVGRKEEEGEGEEGGEKGGRKKRDSGWCPAPSLGSGKEQRHH